MASGTWFYHTRNSNHLDQNIGLNSHKLSLLVNDNTVVCNVSRGKRNNYKTIHDGAVGMKSRFVGHRFLKQARNRVSDWSFRSKFPRRCLLKKACVRPTRAENKKTQLCLQVELAEDKSQSLRSQKSPLWAERMYVTKKISLLWMLQKRCVQTRNRPEAFWQT